MPYADKDRRREANRQNMRRLRAAKAEITIPPVMDAVEREACRFDLLRFINVFLLDLFPLPFSPAHLEIIETLQRVILSGGQYALACPRSFGKSALASLAAGQVHQIPIISCSTLTSIAASRRRFLTPHFKCFAFDKEFIAICRMVDMFSAAQPLRTRRRSSSKLRSNTQ